MIQANKMHTTFIIVCWCYVSPYVFPLQKPIVEYIYLVMHISPILPITLLAIVATMHTFANGNLTSQSLHNFKKNFIKSPPPHPYIQPPMLIEAISDVAMLAATYTWKNKKRLLINTPFESKVLFKILRPRAYSNII